MVHYNDHPLKSNKVFKAFFTIWKLTRYQYYFNIRIINISLIFRIAKCLFIILILSNFKIALITFYIALYTKIKLLFVMLHFFLFLTTFILVTVILLFLGIFLYVFDNNYYYSFLKYFYIHPPFSLSLFSQDFSLHDFGLIHMPKINSIIICFNRSNNSIIKAHSALH